MQNNYVILFIYTIFFFKHNNSNQILNVFNIKKSFYELKIDQIFQIIQQL